MPCVLELCIPARDFPQAQLEQINQVRRELGEELLDETTRPRLYPAPRKERRPRPKQAPAPGSNRADQDTATPTPDIAESSDSTTESFESGHCDTTPWTKCPPDPSSNDLSSPGADTSVRGTCTTGRRAHALIARIPDALLNNPAGDRNLLSRAVEALAGHGLDEQQLVCGRVGPTLTAEFGEHRLGGGAFPHPLGDSGEGVRGDRAGGAFPV